MPTPDEVFRQEHPEAVELHRQTIIINDIRDILWLMLNERQPVFNALEQRIFDVLLARLGATR